MSNITETHTSTVDINEIKIEDNPIKTKKVKRQSFIKKGKPKKTITDQTRKTPPDYVRLGGKKSRRKKRSYTKRR
jgi:hypothetical protein